MNTKYSLPKTPNKYLPMRKRGVVEKILKNVDDMETLNFLTQTAIASQDPIAILSSNATLYNRIRDSECAFANTLNMSPNEVKTALQEYQEHLKSRNKFDIINPSKGIAFLAKKLLKDIENTSIFDFLTQTAIASQDPIAILSSGALFYNLLMDKITAYKLAKY